MKRKVGIGGTSNSQVVGLRFLVYKPDETATLVKIWDVLISHLGFGKNFTGRTFKVPKVSATLGQTDETVNCADGSKRQVVACAISPEGRSVSFGWRETEALTLERFVVNDDESWFYEFLVDVDGSHYAVHVTIQARRAVG